MTLTSIFLALAFAANENSLLIKSAKFCLAKPLAPSASQWLNNACDSGLLVTPSADRKSIQIILDNGKHFPRSFSLAIQQGELKEGDTVTLAGPEFTGACGSPLNLKVTSPAPLEFKKSKVEGKAYIPTHMDLETAASRIAEDMKSVLLNRVGIEQHAYSSNEIKACYSGLQTTIRNFNLINALRQDEKEKLDEAIYPTKDINPEAANIQK